jgi:NAD(P)-dependent dehydrogenase (short-subunit alcohol dehydrogenase family)
MSMLLKDKVAVIYGAGGAIGGAVARAFARDGARLFLTGNRLEPLAAVARDITANGGTVEVAQVDALDEPAVDKHLEAVVGKAGRVDISFNAIGLPMEKIAGPALVEMDAEMFFSSIASYARSYFFTARLAARRMLQTQSGVIMTVTALTSRKAVTSAGGYGASQAAKEALTRDLSVELAPHGIRVVGLRSNAITDTETFREVFEIKAKPMGVTWDQFTQYIANTSHTLRGTTLEELASMAVFVASDRASGLTGTTVNLSMGTLDD